MISRNPIASVFAAALLGVAFAASAATGGLPLDKAPDRSGNTQALQNGARLFMQYCFGCHSAASVRYTQLRDLGLSDKQIRDEFVPSGASISETMQSPLLPKDARVWLSVAPPDMSVIARSRASDRGSGSDYLYTYLRSFYPDAASPTGWNNLQFANVAMPHVLWQMQGERRAHFKEGEHGAHGAFERWETLKAGSMSEAEFDSAMGDLVAFLNWIGEPVQSKRVHTGLFVMLFLLLLSYAAWRLSNVYWKEVR